MFVLIRQPKTVCMCVSSRSRGCMEIPANLTEFCGFGCFHCDFLEGKVDGPTKKNVADPKKSCRDISKENIPLWAFFLQLGCLLRILNQLLANRHLAS